MNIITITLTKLKVLQRVQEKSVCRVPCSIDGDQGEEEKKDFGSDDNGDRRGGDDKLN